MLLELWSAEAPELKQGVVGGLMPVRCRKVGQRLSESLTSGFMRWTQQEEPRESLSPHLEWFPLNLICMFSFHSCHRCDEDQERERERTLLPGVEARRWNHLWNGKPLTPPECHLLARWGGTAGVVNQAAAVQGPATSQHQGLTFTPHVLSGFHLSLEGFNQHLHFYAWYNGD